MQELIDFLKTAFDKLLTVLVCPINYLLDFVATFVLDTANQIPVITLNTVTLTPSMAYVLDYFNFQPVFVTISAAWSVRFIIRRIPFFN